MQLTQLLDEKTGVDELFFQKLVLVTDPFDLSGRIYSRANFGIIQKPPIYIKCMMYPYNLYNHRLIYNI